MTVHRATVARATRTSRQITIIPTVRDRVGVKCNYKHRGVHSYHSLRLRLGFELGLGFG